MTRSRVAYPVLVPILVLAACGGGAGGSTKHDAAARDTGRSIGADAGAGDGGAPCRTFTPSSTESDIAGALATSTDGACFTFAAGTYRFDNQLALGPGNGVTVSGAGIGKTVFDFSAQVSGDDAVFAQSVKDLTLRGFSVEDSPNNAIKALGVIGLTLDSLGASWSGKNRTHGAYGLYPVQCQDVVIENSRVSGASDTGIYVGQSQQVVVRDNEVFENVAGIEIENTYFAEVYGNTAHDNAAGILVFALPGLQQEGCHDILVHDNTVEHNNGDNFAAKGDIVSIVPSGTGSLVMAACRVEFHGNRYEDNRTGALAVLSYLDTGQAITDPRFDPYPCEVYLHDDTFQGNGKNADVAAPFGFLLATGLSAFPGGRVPDVFVDGVVPAKVADESDPLKICVEEPDADAVCDLNLIELNSSDDNLAKILSCSPPGKPQFACTLPALSPVSFPGLTP